MIGTLRNPAGERLDHVFTPGRAGVRDIVVVGHGVTSHHDRPWLVQLCDDLHAVGIPSLRFSFAGNGASEGRFAESTITKEVSDLGAVIDALRGHTIAYVGHSMGAAVGVLRAAEDERIRALVSLAGMVRVQQFMERCFGALVPDHDLMFGKEHCKLTTGFLADAAAVDNVLAAASRIRVPWLLVHGDADELVPLADSREAQAACELHPEIVVLAGADHRFQGKIGAMTRCVVTWLQRTFAALAAAR